MSAIDLGKMSEELLVKQPENLSKIQSKETLKNLRLSTVATTIIAAGGFAVSHHKNLLTGRVKALVGAVALLFAGVAAYFQKYNILSNVEETLGHVFATGFRTTSKGNAIQVTDGDKLNLRGLLNVLDSQTSVHGVVKLPSLSAPRVTTGRPEEVESHLFYAQSCVTGDNQALTRLYLYNVEQKEAVVLTILPARSTIDLKDEGVIAIGGIDGAAVALPIDLNSKSEVFISVASIEELRAIASSAGATSAPRGAARSAEVHQARDVEHRYLLTCDELKAEQDKVGEGKAWKVGRPTT